MHHVYVGLSACVLLCRGAVCCLCTLHYLCFVTVYDPVRMYASVYDCERMYLKVCVFQDSMYFGSVFVCESVSSYICVCM